MLIDCRNLTVRFPGKTAVDGVDLRLNEGERIAVVGESGSGKSTLARALLGLLPKGRMTADGLTIAGRDMRQAADADWRELRGGVIGLMLQDPRYSLHPTMTVGQQIGEVARRSVADCLAEVGLAPDIANRYPHQLSGGQGQRAYLAMVLAQNPRLLIADEPTSALDPDLASQVMDLILSKTAESNRSLLLVTHDIEMALGNCRRLLVMKDGCIVEELMSGDEPRHPFTRRLIEAIPRMPPC